MKKYLLIVLALFASLASAQQSFKLNAKSPFSLALNASVVKDLGLTEDQQSKIRVMMEAFTSELRGIGSAGFSSIEAIQEHVNDVGKEYQNRLISVLSPEQVKRVSELELQIGPVDRILDHHIATKLSLTQEQISKIKDIAEAQMDQSKDISDQVAGEKDKKEMMSKLIKKSRESLDALLSSEQLRILKQLRGRPLVTAV